MGPTVLVAEKQAEQLKRKGYSHYKKGRFGAARDAYTAAITLCPNVSAYWAKRASCHLMLNDGKKAEEDSRKAIELDKSNAKGHYNLGLALSRKEEHHEGIKHLEKALALIKGENPKSHIVELIRKAVAIAKYSEWELESTSRAWELQSLKEACQTAFKQMHNLENSEAAEVFDEAHFSRIKQMEALDAVFRKVSEADELTEVPDYLCYKISLDILWDPVITPSGITYERKVILDHIQKVGKFDPVTREELDESQLVPNFAIKEAVEAFQDKHRWAYWTD